MSGNLPRASSDDQSSQQAASWIGHHWKRKHHKIPATALSKTCLQVDNLFFKKQNFSTEARPRPPCAKTWTCIQALQSHARFLMPQEHKVVSIDTTLCSCWVKCLLLLAFLYFNRDSADFTDISGLHFSNTDDERGLVRLRSKPRSSPAGISPKLPGNLPADIQLGMDARTRTSLLQNTEKHEFSGTKWKIPRKEQGREMSLETLKAELASQRLQAHFTSLLFPGYLALRACCTQFLPGTSQCF